MKLVTCRARNELIRGCEMHAHTAWELILQCTGTASSVVGEEEFAVVPGDLVIVPPGVSHRCYSNELFGDTVIQLLDCPLPQKPFLLHDTDGDIRRLMEMILKQFTLRELFYESIIDHLSEALLQYIKKQTRTKSLFPFVRPFKDLLYENLSNPDFDLAEAIAKSGYHPDYFRRCFRKETNHSPLEYLTHLRIERAKTLLWQDDLYSVETVSSLCGFRDSFYFSTCFKKHTGLSPLAYRKARAYPPAQIPPCAP